MRHAVAARMDDISAEALEHCCGGAGRAGLIALTGKVVLDAYAAANGQLGVALGRGQMKAGLIGLSRQEAAAGKSFMERRGRQAYRFGEWLKARLP